MSKAGFTLLEMLIAIAIVSILAAIAGFQWSSMHKRWTIENEINQMYANLMEARLKAMNKGRNLFIVFGTKQYTIYEDTNPAPDGDEALNQILDTKVLTRETTNEVKRSFTSELQFDKHGFISKNGNIRFENNVSATVDCLVIGATRINIGKWDGSACKTK